MFIREQWNFSRLKGDEAVERFRDRFKETLSDRLGFEIPDDYASRNISPSLEYWTSRVDDLVEALEELLADLCA